MLVKPTLKLQLQNAIDSAFKDAFKEALKVSVLGEQNSSTNKIINKMAEKFANKAADIASKKLSGDLADAIDAYIKSASISIVAAPQAALACGVGPVTGVVNVPPTFVTIS